MKNNIFLSLKETFNELSLFCFIPQNKQTRIALIYSGLLCLIFSLTTFYFNTDKTFACKHIDNTCVLTESRFLFDNTQTIFKPEEIVTCEIKKYGYEYLEDPFEAFRVYINNNIVISEDCDIEECESIVKSIKAFKTQSTSPDLSIKMEHNNNQNELSGYLFLLSLILIAEWFRIIIFRKLNSLN